jgi:hypothetical protein
MAGCGLASDRDIRAYNTCLSRHAQEAAICDGPRQAYEVGDSVLQANSTRIPTKYQVVKSQRLVFADAMHEATQMVAHLAARGHPHCCW